jgi:hypothetical protein
MPSQKEEPANLLRWGETPVDLKLPREVLEMLKVSPERSFPQ